MNGLDSNFIVARVFSVGMYNSGTAPVLMKNMDLKLKIVLISNYVLKFSVTSKKYPHLQ
jgi:hypothetical protein